MSKKALSISLKRNYSYCFDTNNLDDCDSELRNSYENSAVESSQEDEGPTIHKVFNLNLDVYKWQHIQPISTLTVRNQLKSKIKYQNKYVLSKHEWTHLLREETWNQTKIPCSFAFQSHSIKYGERITCFGQCTECNAEIKIVINWLSDNIAHCKGIITDYDPKFTHNPHKKMKLSSLKRNELACELKFKSPIVVRYSLIDSAMNIGVVVPPHIPTTACLRQIKYERECSEHYHENPVLALWFMTKINPYDDIIKHISVFPFYVYYLLVIGSRSTL